MKVVAFSPPADVEFDAVTEPFWASLRQGELSLQRCAHGHGFRMPPTLYCPDCNSTESEWQKLSGRGHLYSYTIVSLNPRDPASPAYVAALVCPEEAPDTKIFSNIIDCSIGDLSVGMELQLVRSEGSVDVVHFRPAHPASRGEG